MQSAALLFDSRVESHTGESEDCLLKVEARQPETDYQRHITS